MKVSGSRQNFSPPAAMNKKQASCLGEIQRLQRVSCSALLLLLSALNVLFDEHDGVIVSFSIRCKHKYILYCVHVALFSYFIQYEHHIVLYSVQL